MNKNQLKKIIAREGLVLLGIILFGIFLILLSRWINKDYFPFKFIPMDYYSLEVALAGKIRTLGIILIFCGYFSYLLTRFIIWAIKTLKKKE